MASLQAQYHQLEVREALGESIMARIGGADGLDALHCQQLELQRDRENDWRKALAVSQDFTDFSTLLIQAVLTATGLHQNQKGEWRPRRNVKVTPICRNTTA